ncbi:hypothetical protein Clacol_001428 [Clathrus columnatus]|uniref:DNA damage-inducible protein 1 n=1 Tax=Clathrus columnatus TaxID=1419009 RepID=A0AAV5A3K1_9AGAM|nr:hypothetical protein Clacol_001428 [Clathrus columnatus]
MTFLRQEVEVDPQMELENIMALLEAESGIPPAEQSISIDGRELSNPRATIMECVGNSKSVLLLRRKVIIAGRTAEQDAEMMRLQILGDPQLMKEIQDVTPYSSTQPELADALINNPPRFAELLARLRQQQQEWEVQKQREIELLNADPFDVEAQRRIEETIRQQAVLENMQHAMEYAPESFGRVTMLYIPVEVNSRPVKAFVDSGAQQTIILSPQGESSNRRFSGIAKGVGTAKILGRVHSAQLKIADLHLACSFTIMEVRRAIRLAVTLGRDVDLLFGLDMLKAHQAIIDLEKNALRIQGREVKFLAEHELPDKARAVDNAEIDDTAEASGSSSNVNMPSSSAGPQHFPGSGQTLGQNPGLRERHQTSGSPSRFSEVAINTLVGLGVSREDAIRALEASGGNVDLAASLLF